jgi:hypothetical protein
MPDWGDVESALGGGVRPDWSGENQRYLIAVLLALGIEVEERLASRSGGSSSPDRIAAAQRTATEAREAMTFPPALERLSNALRLSRFERDLLLLCAGVDLLADFSRCWSRAAADPRIASPTFGLALASLPNPHWSAISPSGPLRSLSLLTLGPGEPFCSRPLKIDENVLHYLAGVRSVDDRLGSLIEPFPPVSTPVPDSHRRIVEQIVRTWTGSGRWPFPAAHLVGVSGAGRRAIASGVCAHFGYRLSILPAHALAGGRDDVTVAQLATREALLSGMALLVDCDMVDPADTARWFAVSRMVDRAEAPIFVASRERHRFGSRPVLAFDVRKPLRQEQRTLWSASIARLRVDRPESCAPGEEPGPLVEQAVGALTANFDLGASAIDAACVRAFSGALEGGSEDLDLPAALWRACRSESRPRLDDLAQHVESASSWDDLILPEPQRAMLREIAVHVRKRSVVYDHWGFGRSGARGLGLSAVFAGASGTGKTMAAEVLGRELELDVYRIDLSQVVSKYIGETEKNLGRIFDAADDGSAILLFDEADALFGKRSEVKDSHDRYANIEVSYLLQRMEIFRGLAILTTNMKTMLDSAFLRRIRFVVEFPFPNAEERAAIWRRVFPRDTPTDGLVPEQLARMNLAGGNIRSTALNAAFLAAEEGQAVKMAHVMRAARAEYAKLKRTLTTSELPALHLA